MQRRGMVPHQITAFLKSILNQLTDSTLSKIENVVDDCEEYGYGDPKIDYPVWESFLNDIRNELTHRKPNKGVKTLSN